LVYTGILARSEITRQMRLADPPADFIVHTVYHLYPLSWPAAPADWATHAAAVNLAFQQGTGAGSFPFGWYSSGALTVKCYDMADAKPRPEKAVNTYTPSTWGTVTVAPRRLAVCMSYYADRNIKRHRGRLFLGPMTSVQSGETIASTWLNQACDLGTALSHVGSGASAHWVLHSPTDGDVKTITHVWANDQWDSVDSREHTEQARTVVAVP
jgi:hypothetical protein